MATTFALKSRNFSFCHYITSLSKVTSNYTLNIIVSQAITPLTNNLPYVLLILGKFSKGCDMDARQERGLVIVATFKIEKNKLGWKVPE